MKHEIRVIKTEQDYQEAMDRLSSLMDAEIVEGSSEEAELELLALVIHSYEKSQVAPVIVDPIDAILFRIEQLGLAKKDLAPYIGSASKVSEVLSRKRPLSLTMIRKLHAGLGIPAEVLIRDQDSEIDLSKAPSYEYSSFPLKEMFERGCFPSFRGAVNRLTDYAEELIRGFMSELDTEASPAMLRAPMHQNGGRDMDEYALLAWRLCVLKKAHAMNVTAEYKEGSITADWLRDLAKLSRFEMGPKLAQEYLADHGIALVIEKHFQKTYLDGAAFLSNGKPIVAITMRHDRLDNFWFVLFHELIHVQKHLDSSCAFIPDNLDDKVHSMEIREKEANEGAREALISQEEWLTSDVSKTSLAGDAEILADKLRIHPAIVAGRVRFETGDWRLLSGMLGKGMVSKIFSDQVSDGYGIEKAIA